MYFKLALKNARRSAKDYLIYIITLTICVALFYAFLSISNSFYKPDIGQEFSMEILGDRMKITICLITFRLLSGIKLGKYFAEQIDFLQRSRGICPLSASQFSQMFRKEKSVKILSMDVHRQCLLFQYWNTSGFNLHRQIALKPIWALLSTLTKNSENFFNLGRFFAYLPVTIVLGLFERRRAA